MTGRLRRIGLILFLGVLLQLPTGTLQGCLAETDPVKWERLVSFNVLQTIGIGLLTLHGALLFSKRRAHFEWGVLALALAVFAAASITYRTDVDEALPMWARGMANLYHQSRFPLVPYAAFMFLGAFLGARFWKVRGQENEHMTFVLASVGASILIAFEVIIRKVVPGVVFPYGMPLPDMAGNTFARAGCALLIISVIYYIGRHRVVLPRFSFVLSKDALSIYFVHLLLVYGAADVPSLFHHRAARMTPLEVWAFVVGLIASMTVMASLFGYLRKRCPTAFTMARRVVILSIVLPFVLLPQLAPLGILLGFLASLTMVVIAKRLMDMKVAKSPARGEQEG
jgi:hypothetical protein